MSPEETLGAYLDAVAGQIRWRRARPYVLRELSDHIADEARTLEVDGLERDAALERAVAEMGDPLTVGAQLNRLHRPQNRWGLFLCAAAVLFAGLWAIRQYQGVFYELRRQLAGLAVALPLLLVLWFSDYTRLFRRRWAPGALLFLLVLGGPLTRMLGLRMVSNGVWRYPGYIALLFPLLYAAALCLLRGRGLRALVLCGVVPPLLAAIALLGPCAAAALISAAVMLFLLGAAVFLGWFDCKKAPGLLCAWGPAALFCLPALAGILRTPYMTLRLSLFLDPALDPLGRGFQLRAVRYIWDNISLTRGLSAPSPFQMGEHTTDLLLTSLMASYGRWVFWAAVALTALFAVYVLRRIRGLHSVTGRLTALSAFLVLLLQALTYLPDAAGWGLFGPLAFPLFTPGAAMLIIDCALLGVILSVLRMDPLVRDAACARPLPRASCAPAGQFTIALPGRAVHVRIEHTDRPHT